MPVAYSFDLRGSGNIPTSGAHSQYVIYAKAINSTTAGLYWLDLTTSTQPVQPTSSIGAFTVPITGGDVQSVVCGGIPLQANRTQPATLKAVLVTLVSGTCGSGTYNYYYVDHAANTVTQIPTGGATASLMAPVYDQNSGALTEVVVLSANQFDVFPYNGSNPFANSPTTVAGTFSSATQLDTSLTRGSVLIAAQPTQINNGYRVFQFNSGTASPTAVYTQSATGGTIGSGPSGSCNGVSPYLCPVTNSKSAESDAAYVYFVDSITSGLVASDSGTQRLVSVDANGAYTVLYTTSAGAAATTPMTVLGADGSHVLVAIQQSGATSSGVTWNLYSLSASSVTTTLPAPIYTFTGSPDYTAPESASALATPGSAASTLVFVNFLGCVQNCATTEKYSAIVNPSSTLNATFVANSWLLPDSVGETGNVLQLQGITDPQANFLGGGTVAKINLTQMIQSGSYPDVSATSTLTAPGGGTVTIPSGDGVVQFLDGWGSDVVVGATLAASGDALICTLSSNQIVKLAPPASPGALFPY